MDLWTWQAEEQKTNGRLRGWKSKKTLITLSWIQAHVQSKRGAAGAHDKELTNPCCPGAHGGVCMAAIPRRVVVLAALQPSRT